MCCDLGHLNLMLAKVRPYTDGTPISGKLTNLNVSYELSIDIFSTFSVSGTSNRPAFVQVGHFKTNAFVKLTLWKTFLVHIRKRMNALLNKVHAV